VISGDYFQLLKVPVVAGRAFTPADGDKAPRVAIVNESFARRFWPNQNPLGKRFGYSTNRILCEVVGVAKDTKFRVSDTENREEMYFPVPQRPRLNMSLLVRTTVDPTSLAAAIQREIQNVDRDQAVTEVVTLEHVVGESIEQPRLTMFLLGILWKRTTQAGALTAGLLTIPLSLFLESAFPKMPFLNRTGLVFWICMAVCAIVSLLTKPKPESELKGLIWSKESLSLPPEQRALMRGWRRPIIWCALVMGLVLYFFIRYP